jgi:uncharacterized membrane protein (UPF0127 family)
MHFHQDALITTSSGTFKARLAIASNSWQRFWGLMFQGPLSNDPIPHGLLLTRCPSVHSFFMRYTIDVVYLAKESATEEYRVTHTTQLRPWRVSIGKSFHLANAQTKGQTKLQSRHAMELPAGAIQQMNIAPGDKMESCHA